jgi:hypothetical protein
MTGENRHATCIEPCVARQVGNPKTCNRCGRTGSHAFRRTQEGLFECTTTTACRARAIRNSGPRHDGRGRLPRTRGLVGAAPGVAYVIGEDGPERELVASTLRELSDLAVVAGAPSKATLAALASRNVKLIAAAAGCLESLAFRNEFVLRCRQPKLSSVPVVLYGQDGQVNVAAERMPAAAPLPYHQPDDIGPGLRRQLEHVIGGEAPEAELQVV